MNRWTKIESLFRDALSRPEAQREAFLSEACGGDSDLLREVESLLTNHRDETSSEPWAAAAAARLMASTGSLGAGHQLGPYRILLQTALQQMPE